MKIDLSDTRFHSVELTFANGVTLTVDQTSGGGSAGIVVKAGEGDLQDLKDLREGDRKFFNPQNAHGFILTRRN